MSKSSIIVALTLSSLHYGVFAQQSPFVSNIIDTEDAANAVLAASDGNPWALPDPSTEYGYAEPQQQPARRIERPRYITQEELNKLGRLPPERSYLAPSWLQQNTNRLPGELPPMGAMPGGTGYYGQGYYPSGSGYYGSPYYGTSPYYSPYGGAYDLPYGGGILPFLY